MQKTSRRGEAPIQPTAGPTGGGTASRIQREEPRDRARSPPAGLPLCMARPRMIFFSGRGEKEQEMKERRTWGQSGLEQGMLPRPGWNSAKLGEDQQHRVAQV